MLIFQIVGRYSAVGHSSQAMVKISPRGGWKGSSRRPSRRYKTQRHTSVHPRAYLAHLYLFPRKWGIHLLGKQRYFEYKLERNQVLHLPEMERMGGMFTTPSNNPAMRRLGSLRPSQEGELALSRGINDTPKLKAPSRVVILFRHAPLAVIPKNFPFNLSAPWRLSVIFDHSSQEPSRRVDCQQLHRKETTRRGVTESLRGMRRIGGDMELVRPIKYKSLRLMQPMYTPARVDSKRLNIIGRHGSAKTLSALQRVKRWDILLNIRDQNCFSNQPPSNRLLHSEKRPRRIVCPIVNRSTGRGLRK